MVHTSIEKLSKKRPNARFGMRLGDGPDSLFAFRWASNQFSSLVDFCTFCDQYAHLFPLLVNRFDQQELELYLIEENLSLFCNSTPIKADAKTLIDTRFGVDTVAWLGIGEFMQVDDSSIGDALFLRATGDGGFLVALVEEDFNDHLGDQPVAINQRLPVKKPVRFVPAELPFDDPHFSAFTINTPKIEPKDNKFQLALNKIHQRVADHIGEPTIVHFSAFTLDEAGNPIDNLDEVAILDYAVVIADADETYAPTSRAFESEWMDEPTWLDLCAVLHSQMKHTRDFHHIFLEGVTQVRGASMHKPQASLFQLLLGS